MISESEITDAGNLEHVHNFQLKADTVRDISVVFYNKEPHDTVVDTNGDIIEDLYLVIDKINVDGHDLLPKINRISQYRTDQGIMHDTYNWLAFRGEFRVRVHRNLLYTLWLSGIV